LDAENTDILVLGIKKVTQQIPVYQTAGIAPRRLIFFARERKYFFEYFM
jgi:hypothetical protein